MSNCIWIYVYYKGFMSLTVVALSMGLDLFPLVLTLETGLKYQT